MKIACLMGTAGRYSLACESLACFLQQTELSSATLLIYNQHPVPLIFDYPNVRIVNEAQPAKPLRCIKRRMLELADPSAEFIHWCEDDDLYLPWHLEDCLGHIGTNDAWKPASSWIYWGNDKLSLESSKYRFEGSWIFRAHYAIAAPLNTHPTYTDHPVYPQTVEAGKLAITELGGRACYIYRWDSGEQHVSAYGGSLSEEEQLESIVRWRTLSTDVRPDGRMAPADMTERWRQYLAGIKDQVTPAEWELNRRGVLMQPRARVPAIRGTVDRPERSASASKSSRTAYLILAHHQPKHLARLIRALDQNDSYFFIHVDSKVPIQPFKDAVPQRDNIIFVPDRVPVEWGTFSLVQAELHLIGAAIAFGLSFKYYTLLSGSDYPIKHKQEIAARLQASDRQHICIDRELTTEPQEPFAHALKKLPEGRYYENLIPYKGSAWWSLTEDCIRFICDFVRDNPGYVDVHRNIFAPDEFFFHTLVKHSPFAVDIAQDCAEGGRTDHTRHALHFIDWAGLRERGVAMPEGSLKLYDLTLREGDLDDLFASGCLFARKFDERKSDKLLDMIDAHVHWPKSSKNLTRPSNGSAVPELTVGMATYNDYDGVYFTLEALRLYQDLANTELLVIDNYGCDATRDLVRNVKGTYHRVTDVVGTSAPRDLVFRLAAGNAVLCCDCHVMFVPGAIARLKQYYRDHPDTDDLLQGPLLYDDAKSIATHFDPQWRQMMWGTWGTDPRGEDVEGEPFEIPMQGLGVFSCRKSAWLGFNSGFRGFGGEEGYIHEKFRQAGRKCWCLPSLRWMHRFYPPGKVTYTVVLQDRIVNYLLGHLELGLHIEPVLTHFKDHGFEDTRQALLALEKRFPQFQPELRRQLNRLGA
jgi:hypothetical protein